MLMSLFPPRKADARQTQEVNWLSGVVPGTEYESCIAQTTRTFLCPLLANVRERAECTSVNCIARRDKTPPPRSQRRQFDTNFVGAKNISSRRVDCHLDASQLD